MPIFRQRRKRRKDPYPRQGTPEGDALIGPCDGAGCERTLKRYDIFFCLLSGRTLCLDCYERTGADLASAIPSDPTPIEQPLVFDGELPF